MCSASRLTAAVMVAACCATACRSTDDPQHVDATNDKGQARHELRVCSDPNNLPFSNDRRQGFENAIAEIVAHDLNRTVVYTWWPQRRGFFRTTLNAGVCDVVIGVPQELEQVLTTTAYYRSTYAFVTRRARALRLHSFDDPRLRTLSIGVHLVGDDYASVPPGEALARRGIARNVRGFSIYGDYAKPNPPADLIDAVANGSIDAAVAWGPLAGYFAARSSEPLDVVPADPVNGVRMEFAIAMGVRRSDAPFRDVLNTVIAARQNEIARVLDTFHVPRLP